MNLTLIRTTSSDVATCGEITIGQQVLYTLEQPWRLNAIGRSCVPTGTYLLIPYHSPVHGFTWCLHSPANNVYGTVPIPVGGRAYCELHSANYAEQLAGCIALGLDAQPMLDPITEITEPAIENSRDAVAELVKILGAMSSGHTLSITTESLET